MMSASRPTTSGHSKSHSDHEHSLTHLNVNSLQYKLNNVSSLLHNFHIDIFGLSETKLGVDVADGEL